MYTDAQREVTVVRSSAANLASLAVIGTWAPGYTPVTVRAVAIVCSTSVGAAFIVLVKHRPTAGSASGEVTIATLDGATLAAGKSLYADGLSVKVSPGGEIAFEVTDVSATGVVVGMALVENTPEVPGNNANMIET